MKSTARFLIFTFLILAGQSTHAVADAAPLTQQGAAFSAWRDLQNPQWTPESLARLNERLKVIVAAANTPVGLRARCLATRVLATRAATGKLPDALWDEVAAFVKALDTDLDSLAALLPVAFASADLHLHPARQVQAGVWTRRFFAALSMRDLALPHQSTFAARAALLDPLRLANFVVATGEPDKCRLPVALARRIAAEIAATAPHQAAALLRHHFRHDARGQAWLIKESGGTRETSGREFVQELLRRIAAKEPNSFEHDQILAFAAYQFAQTSSADDYSLALKLAGGIYSFRTRLEVLRLILQDAPARDIEPALATQIEAALRGAVADWKPGQTSGSNVPQRLQLAAWLKKRGRSPEASSIIHDITDIKRRVPQAIFTDTWLTAHVLESWGTADAREWHRRTIEAALYLDRQTGSRYDESWGGLPGMGATAQLAHSYLSNNQPEEALQLIQRMKQEAPEAAGADSILKQISFNLLTADPAANFFRVQDLAAEIEDIKQRAEVLARLAVYLAPHDPVGTQKLLSELPEHHRRRARLEVFLDVPSERETLRPLASTMIETMLATRNSKTLGVLLEDEAFKPLLSRMPVEALLTFEPLFAGDQTFFVDWLLYATAREANVLQEKTGKWYFAPEMRREETLPWSTPLGAPVMKYALEIEAREAENWGAL